MELISRFNDPNNGLYPSHLMIAISGYSGSGKDETAKVFVENHGAIQTGFADVEKRHLHEIYGFSEDQLFGPSSSRSAGDFRYPKPVYKMHGCAKCDKTPENLNPDFRWHSLKTVTSAVNHLNIDIEKFRKNLTSTLIYSKSDELQEIIIYFRDNNPFFFLSPREALQLRCDILNQLYEGTWINLGIAKQIVLSDHSWYITENGILGYKKYSYSRIRGVTGYGNEIHDVDDKGIHPGDPFFTCFADVRHWHEVKEFENLAENSNMIIPVLIRIKRPSVPKPPFNHKSELEMEEIPDSRFHFIINNDSTIESLRNKTEEVVKIIMTPEWKETRNKGIVL